LAERVVISVDPGAVDLNLKVQDVFGHVLDLFDLLGHSGEATDDAIAWRLVSVSMNSPLLVVAEAIATRPSPSLDIDNLARSQKSRFARNVSELKRGRVPDAWRGAREVKRVSRAFNAEQPTTTRMQLETTGAEAPSVVEVTPADLSVVATALETAIAEATVKPKEQVGSIEGQLLEVGFYYNNPAIKLKERKSRAEVWCIVTEAHRQEVASETNFEDVWAGRRVLVEGIIVYDRGGGISRVVADSIHIVKGAQVQPDALHDPDITSGLTPAEYLERFREGTLG
jgi:hypothetical protein